MAKQSIPFFLSLLAALSLMVACQPAALDEIIDPNPQEPEVVPERTTIPYSLTIGTEATRVSWVTSTNSYQFKEGDKLDIPFDIFKQKPKIHIEVPSNMDEPCGVSLLYKRPENETEIYGRLLAMIIHNARQKYIDKLD